MLLRLAWRNVWRNGRRTAIVIAAVAVGIAGVILSMAVNYGMVVQMVDTAIRTELGHLQVHARGFEDDPGLEYRLADGGRPELRLLASLPAVRASAPRVRGQGLLSSPRASAGVRVVGIEPAREAKVSDVARSIVAGAYLDATPQDRHRVLLGEALAERLQVGVGDKVVLSATDAHGNLAGAAFRVAGLFRTASLDLDRSTVYMRLDESQALFGIGNGISEVVAVARDRSDVAGIVRTLRSRLPAGVEVESWKQLAPLLVYLIDAFDQMAWVVYAAVFVAMAFGIANTLLMAVFERTREIGVVRAIGMSARRVVGMIVLESIFLTFVGLVVGFALTGAVLFLLRGGIDLSHFAEGLTSIGVGTTVVPVARPADFGTPCVVALVTAIAASLWPAWRAAQARPADALRHV